MLAIRAKVCDLNNSSDSRKDAHRQNSGHGGFHLPVHLHVPKNGDGQKGEENVGQHGDAGVEKGGELEVAWWDAGAFDGGIPD